MPGGGNRNRRASGPPGVWSQLADAATIVAANTVVVLATIPASALKDGEVVLFPAPKARGTTNLNIFEGSTGASPGAGNAVYQLARTTAGDYQAKIRHAATAAVTFDWVVYKVRPL